MKEVHVRVKRDGCEWQRYVLTVRDETTLDEIKEALRPHEAQVSEGPARSKAPPTDVREFVKNLDERRIAVLSYSIEDFIEWCRKYAYTPSLEIHSTAGWARFRGPPGHEPVHATMITRAEALYGREFHDVKCTQRYLDMVPGREREELSKLALSRVRP